MLAPTRFAWARAAGLALPLVIASSLATAAGAAPPAPPPDLAPTGTLRAAVNFGNPNNASKDPSTGELRGVAVDLARALAARLGVPLALVPYPGIPPMLDGLRAGAWDVGFAFDPALEPGDELDFATPHIGVENTYLVPADSPIRAAADADRPDVRIAVARGNSPDRFLTGTLRYAHVVRTDTVPAALALLRGGQADAFAGSRQAALGFLPQLPGARLLDDNFLIANLAVALPKRRTASVAYVSDFIEQAKASGVVRQAIERAGLHGVRVSSASITPNLPATGRDGGERARTTAATPPAALMDLVPTGKLRVALNIGNSVLATKDPTDGELHGVAVDLGHELAARLGVPFVPVEYPSVPKIMAGLQADAWDVAFLAIDPARAAELEFTVPYMEVDNTYLVPKQSPIRNVADADRPGVRIAVPSKSAPDLFLTRELQRATLLRADTGAAAFELLRSGQADAFAADRQSLLEFAEHLPGSQVLGDRFLAVQHAIAMPKGRAAGLAYVSDFDERMKASGAVQQAIARARLRGVQVAPDLPNSGAGGGDRSTAGVRSLLVAAILLLAGGGAVLRRPARRWWQR